MVSRVTLACSLGALLSAYALYVEYAASLDPNYKALCDISETVSCSRVFTSEWGSIFILPNSLLGLGGYITMAALHHYGYKTLFVAAAAFSTVFSIVLAGIMFVELGDTCPVCSAMYTVNLVLAAEAWVLLQSPSDGKSILKSH